MASRRSEVVVGTGVVGTATRKMKTAPADIFIYGVDKSTVVQDIIEDLAFSDIVVKAENVVKKTRENASVDSYKISIKAEDLQKALNPDIWPMRVKVREWIHYPSRRQGRVGGAEGAAHGGQFGQGRHMQRPTAAAGASGGAEAAAQQQQQQQIPGLVLQNRFNGIGEETA